MSHSSTLNPYVLKLLPKNLDKQRILDVGCGNGLWGYNIRLNKDGEPIITGIDIWKPYLKRLRKTRIYDDLIQADAIKLPFPNKYFDFALCIAVLPHLNKQDSLIVLDELERVSQHIIVSTHLGFSSQDEIDWNPFQKHLSSWYLQDFTHRGYKTITVPSIMVPVRYPFDRILTLLYQLVRYILNPNIKHLKAEIIAWK